MEKGKLKVSVLYPSGEGRTLDMDYYSNKHVPMVANILGDAVIGATVEKGISGAEPGSTPEYLGMANLYFNSLSSFQNSFGPNAEKILSDIPNFYNGEPVMQISEVVL